MKHIFLSFLLFTTCMLGAQERSTGEARLAELAPIVVSAKGTGQTTGHVANVVLQNNGSSSINMQVGPLLIPSNGNSQGYLIPDQQNVYISPNGTTVLKLTGYCTNMRLSAAAMDENLTSVERWIVPDGKYTAAKSTWTIPTGYELNINQELGKYPYKLTYPSSTDPFVYTIDFDKNANTAADLLLQVVKALEKEYDHMEMLNTVRTPYVINLKKQKEAIVQHTFWMFTSALQGDGYLKETFREKMLEQYNANVGDQISAVTQSQFEAGVNDFWNAFLTVAQAAKVFTITE